MSLIVGLPEPQITPPVRYVHVDHAQLTSPAICNEGCVKGTAEQAAEKTLLRVDVAVRLFVFGAGLLG
jgi:hypothetical protein